MKTKKLNSKTLTNSMTGFTGVALGTMGSRVIAEKVPLFKKSPNIKHGILTIVGLGLASLMDDKDDVGKFLQATGVGMAATQSIALLKNIIKPEAGTFPYIAMGNPEDNIIVLDNNHYYDDYSYDTNTEYLDEQTQFLGMPEDEFSLV